MTNKHQSGGFAAYQEYIRHLNRTMPEPDQIEQFASGYQDFLQSPLQVGINNDCIYIFNNKKYPL